MSNQKSGSRLPFLKQHSQGLDHIKMPPGVDIPSTHDAWIGSLVEIRDRYRVDGGWIFFSFFFCLNQRSFGEK